MAISKKLEIIYHNGKPDGIRIIRRALSTVITYVIPRTLLDEARQIKDLNKHGIYYLINENDENIIAQIYIGQTKNGISRLDDHNKNKEFWNKAIMFLSDKKTFTLDIISGLEKYVILKAQESKRYSIKNIVVPKYIIDEYDLPLIEETYEEINFIMATQGYKMIDDQVQSNAKIFYTKKNGVVGKGMYYGDKFELMIGSEIDFTKTSYLDSYNRQRGELLKKGEITLINDKYILQVNLAFNSPSGAAEFVLGGSQNGWVEWKDNKNKTLDSIYRTKK